MKKREAQWQTILQFPKCALVVDHLKAPITLCAEDCFRHVFLIP